MELERIARELERIASELDRLVPLATDAGALGSAIAHRCGQAGAAAVWADSLGVKGILPELGVGVALWPSPMDVTVDEEMWHHVWLIVASLQAPPAPSKTISSAPGVRVAESVVGSTLFDMQQAAIRNAEGCRVVALKVRAAIASHTAPHQGYTVSDLAAMAAVSTDTISNYAKAAKLPTPKRGGKNHRFTPPQAKAILTRLRDLSTSQKTKSLASGALDNLK